MTGRLVHPNQRWHDFAGDEADPPAWKGSDQKRRSIFCAVAELPAGKEPVVAVYRLAHWRGDPEQAELYLWAPPRRSVLLAAIAEARGMGIGTLRMHAYGLVAGWLGELGEPVGQAERILARPVA